MKKLLSILLLATACGPLTSCKNCSGVSYIPPGHIGLSFGDPGDQSHYGSPKQR